jgi:hypothetical protein
MIESGESVEYVQVDQTTYVLPRGNKMLYRVIYIYEEEYYIEEIDHITFRDIRLSSIGI